MFLRATLAILVAVVVAMSRPIASGGDHDLIAVGVVVTQGESRTLHIGPPTDAAREAYLTLLRSGAGVALRQGSPVYVHLTAEDLVLPASTTGTAEGEGTAKKPALPRSVRAFVFYGHQSRAHRSVVEFVPDGESSAAAEADGEEHEGTVTDSLAKDALPTLEVARETAGQPGAVAAAAARLLVRSTDGPTLGDAFDVLLRVDPDGASALARKMATEISVEPSAEATTRRILAVRVLKRLGGADVFPDEFKRLLDDRDEMVRDAATSDTPR